MPKRMASNECSQIRFPPRDGRTPDPLHEEKERRLGMTISKKFAGVVTFSLLLAAAGVAGETNKGKLHVAENVTIGGKQLSAGDYQLEWTGTGSTVELSISSGKETVAKIPAQILPLKVAIAHNAYSTDSAAGTKTVTDIFLSGKKYELSIGEASAAAPAAATTAKAQGNN
jgi:hypothetical protein